MHDLDGTAFRMGWLRTLEKQAARGCGMEIRPPLTRQVGEGFGSGTILLPELRRMRQMASGGGYICMSGNSDHSSVKQANYVAMTRAAREYGRYPVSVWTPRHEDIA